MTVRLALTCTIAVLGALVASTSVGVMAQNRGLAMLDRLQAGDWEMRARDAPGEPRRLCLSNARRLIQLRHPGQNCSRVVVEDTADAVTVQYTCPGRGYGRTHIRRETDNLVQIDSQGIAQGLPFSFDAEARRVGACTG
jgi:hypothetical protein